VGELSVWVGAIAPLSALSCVYVCDLFLFLQVGELTVWVGAIAPLNAIRRGGSPAVAVASVRGDSNAPAAGKHAG